MFERFQASRIGKYIILVIVLGASSSVSANGMESFQKEVMPVLDKYCLKCHSGEKAKSDLDLEVFSSGKLAIGKVKTWKKVLERITDGGDPMPPFGEEYPSNREITKVKNWIEGSFPEINKKESKPKENLGILGLRRFNKAEYVNTVKDIFGKDFGVANELPDDPVGKQGFDNNSESLGFSSSVVNAYLNAGEKVAVGVTKMAKQRFSASMCWQSKEEKWPECAGRFLKGKLSIMNKRAMNKVDREKYILNISKTFISSPINFESYFKILLGSLLLSPDFLFRLEIGSNGSEELTDVQLAYRMSYFLWSRPPDKELLQLAYRKKLVGNSKLIRSQSLRMINDVRFDGFIENFGGYWLGFRLLKNHELDETVFPSYTSKIRNYMRSETKLTFSNAIKNGKTLKGIIDSDTTYLNRPLAEYYSIPYSKLNAQESEFQEFSVAKYNRGGILLQGAFLSLHSSSTETSPVRRGKWLLENLLCSAPPPPPAGVDTSVDEKLLDKLNTKQILALHREDKKCAVCHNIMDPVGLPFEKFNAAGLRRSTYPNGDAIEIDELVFDQHKITSAKDLKRVLANDPRLPACFVKTLMSYSLGRKIGRAQQSNIDSVVSRTKSDNHRLKEVIVETILNKQFQSR